MSETKRNCKNCQEIKFCWKLGKKAHEKDNEYTIKEYYCRDCLTELDKTKCWKDYSVLWFIDEGGQGQEKINFCADRYNETERLDKENKDYCHCLLKCDRHKRELGFNDDCKACKQVKDKSNERERERERAKLFVCEVRYSN